MPAIAAPILPRGCVYVRLRPKSRRAGRIHAAVRDSRETFCGLVIAGQRYARDVAIQPDDKTQPEDFCARCWLPDDLVSGSAIASTIADSEIVTVPPAVAETPRWFYLIDKTHGFVSSLSPRAYTGNVGEAVVFSSEVEALTAALENESVI